MDLFRQKLLLLHHWKGVGWNAIYHILKADPTLSSINEFTIAELKQNFLLPTRSTPYKDLQLDSTISLLEGYGSSRIIPITIFDDHYPTLLKEIYQPPWVIFAKGDINLLHHPKKLAVVGARKATTYGKLAIQLLFPDLIRSGYAIVSGLARGIDAISHETAMNYGGRTIAVIAGGINHIYPKENLILAQRMLNEQLIISEFPPDTRPERWHFPLRNRIISGISSGTLIVEAEKRSGSLITANYALHEGREVFAIPGSILNPLSVGTNELIQQGAKLVKTVQDITEELAF
ncbi:DNA-protecting protein DprA [Bacillus sp. DNRA2]|uniref:DNA-processing protein DprA n=1 Tax=Bacillus sp. DNRA2 TaxID=2723053 RepID=UPI00145E1982|nr:DNA-processing protein DprA [Bacillus sp. DNRA2]NMD69496.1 DNA-protecting protein DprA [Bacillus sp. DNRA2]